jgi:peptidyl-prolyl cis-trans isomerase C
MAFVFALILAALTQPTWAQKAKPKPAPKRPPASPALVKVDGKAITEADLQRMLVKFGAAESPPPEKRKAFLQILVDEALIRQFLASRKISVDKEIIDEQVQKLRRLIERKGNFEEHLQRTGYTLESLRDEFALSLNWRAYLAQVVTDEQIQQYFTEHHEELDGTKIRASHILIKAPTATENPELEAARKKLEDLRAEIVAGKISFADAARKYSEAPSGEQGGDVDFFAYQGKMPEAFSKVAFHLKSGEVSQPFTTQFGVHLCVVTDRKPGDISLEDVRSDVLGRIAQDLWTEKAAELRSRAKIEWLDK